MQERIDLSLVPVGDLMHELKKRFETLVLIGGDAAMRTDAPRSLIESAREEGLELLGSIALLSSGTPWSQIGLARMALEIVEQRAFGATLGREEEDDEGEEGG